MKLKKLGDFEITKKHASIASFIFFMIGFIILMILIKLWMLPAQPTSVYSMFNDTKSDFVALKVEPNSYADKCSTKKIDVTDVEEISVDEVKKADGESDFKTVTSDEKIDGLSCDYYMIYNRHLTDQGTTEKVTSLTYIPIIRVEVVSDEVVDNVNKKLEELKHSDMSLVRSLYEYGRQQEK